MSSGHVEPPSRPVLTSVNPSVPRPAHGLDQRWFCDSEIYQLEQKLIFGRYWLAIDKVDASINPGTSVPINIVDHSLLLHHGFDRQTRALSNVCRHRGCQLVEGKTESNNGSIRCPYHGWTYRETGSLAAAPNMSEVGAQDDGALDLPSYNLDHWANQWFINFDADSMALNDWLAPLQQLVGPWLQSTLRFGRRIEYTVNANWKLIFQNFSECYHCRFVHPGLNALTRFDTASNELTNGPILGGPMRLNDDANSMTVDGRPCANTLPGLDPTQQKQVHYFTVFPNLFFSPHPDYIMVHRLDPIDLATTKIVCEFFFDERSFESGDFRPDAAADFWDEVNRQDWDVCERTQIGVASKTYRPGPYAPSETMVSEFDRYYRAAFASQLV